MTPTSTAGLHQAMQTRLDQLRRQLADGEAALADLDAQREQLVANLLRLSGAVQALGEVLAAAEDQDRQE